MNFLTVLMTLAGIAVGAVVAVLVYAWLLRQKAADRLRVPHVWPLGPRGLVTTDELLVWKWLRNTFPDQQVLVKVAVLRFTTPLEKTQKKEKDREQVEKWMELLNNVYTTFTVTNADGKVLGCVDVQGKRAVSRASRELKENLLSDCGIAYTSVRSSQLPTASAMRAAFLGEVPVELVQEPAETRGGDSGFHADIKSFTKQRIQAAKDAALKELNKEASEEAAHAARTASIGFGADGTGLKPAGKPDRFSTSWDDSFIQSADTRPGKLE